MRWHQLNFDRVVGSNLFLKIPVVAVLMYYAVDKQMLPLIKAS